MIVVCVPTYNRPELFARVVASVGKTPTHLFAQVA